LQDARIAHSVYYEERKEGIGINTEMEKGNSKH
jgi:hypothetical protein